MRHVHRTMVLMMFACAGSAAADPCLLTPAELHAATGREFEAGTPGQDIVTEEPHCTYRETKNAKRHVMVRILTQKAPTRFEASKRTLHFGNDSIDLKGVGDAAFYSGTTAGVLLGEQAIILSTLRRASDPKIDRSLVAELLRTAAERLKLL